MKALAEVNRAAYDKLLAHWQVVYRRRRNLWAEMKAETSRAVTRQCVRRLSATWSGGSLSHVKTKKERAQKPTAGTVVGAKHRARCNQLGDPEREKLGDEFLKL